MISLKQCRYPKLVKCGRCSQIGYINFYYDKTNQTPRYYVRHERIGSWINTKAAKYRRCYQNPEHYEYMNKQNAFYEERLKDGYEAEALQYTRTKLLRRSKVWTRMREQGML